MPEADEPMVTVWVSIASWFTPIILFCALNLMIGIIFITSNLKSHNKHQQEEHSTEDNPPQLFRVPSLLDRVKSINFSLCKSYPQQPEAQFADPVLTDQIPNQNHSTDHYQSEEYQHHVTRSKSAGSGEAPVGIPAKMKKSASEKSVTAKFEDVDRRRPATVRERNGKGRETASFGEDEEVDAKADDFINRFKQQLKLQRLDSILRYRELLNRGFGK